MPHQAVKSVAKMLPSYRFPTEIECLRAAALSPHDSQTIRKACPADRDYFAAARAECGLPRCTPGVTPTGSGGTVLEERLVDIGIVEIVDQAAFPYILKPILYVVITTLGVSILGDSLAAGRNVSGVADTKSCALCRSVAEARLGDAAAVHNRKLLETPQFIVLPSVGPLVVGHVMVVSKAHCASLASMGKDAIDEYESVAGRLHSAPLLRDSDPLEAEHGSTENNKVGACVIHTHVHWIPNMGQFWAAFEQRLRRRPEGCLLEVGARGPYIFARAAGGRGIFEAHGLRSQTIRGILCDLLEREDTDWMQALRMNWVEETVQAWLHDGQRS